MAARSQISVLIVTFDHADEIDACLDAARGQEGVEVEIVVADNASCDDTAERVGRHAGVRLLEMDRNHGFAAGMNAAFAASGGEHVLILNPDCVMQPGCAARAARLHEELWAAGPPSEPVAIFCPAAACVMAAQVADPARMRAKWVASLRRSGAQR